MTDNVMIYENFNDSAVDNGNDIDNIRIIPATEYHHHEWFRSNYDNRGVEVHSRDLYPLWQVIRSHDGRHRPVIPTSFHGHPMENSISFMITLDSHRSCYRLISVTTRWGVILNRKLHIGHSNGLVSSKITSKSFGGKSWNYAFFQKGRRDSASAHTAQEEG